MRATLAILGACGGPPPDPPPPRAPDVLLVVEDTMRADALSAYGNPRNTSPQLEAIAAAGVRFADVSTPGSWTLPSHASLFTGLFPWQHGAHFADPDAPDVWALDPMPWVVRLPSEAHTMLAERFGAAGYRTASVSGNIIVSDALPQLTRGFDTATYAETDGEVVAQATALLADPDDRPLFLFVNLYGAHGPHEIEDTDWLRPQAAALAPDTAAPWLRPFLTDGGKTVDLHRVPPGAKLPGPMAHVAGTHPIPPEGLSLLRDVYEGEVTRVDWQLHRLLVAWNASGRESGIVAATSDHGEYFGEHGQMVHGRSLYTEVIQVPLVLSAPGRIAAGLVVETPVQMHDLHDTLLELAGLAERDQAPRSLLAHTEGAGPARPILAKAWPDAYWGQALGGRYTEPQMLWRSGRDALLWQSEDVVSLYDLHKDPGMTQDLAAVDPGRTGQLLQEAQIALPQTEAEGSTAQPDAATLERLRSLGYVGG